MFKIVNGANATIRQLEQIVDLQYSRTWFFEFMALNNAKKISVEEYLKEYLTRPRLPFTTMVLDERDNVAGFIMGSTAEKEAQLKSDPALKVSFREYEDHEAMDQYVKAYEALGLANDYKLHFFCVRSDLRGVTYAEFDNKKISDILLEECVQQAKKGNCARITSSLKKSNYKSYNFFINKNKAKIILKHDITETVFNDTILAFALELHD